MSLQSEASGETTLKLNPSEAQNPYDSGLIKMEGLTYQGKL